MKNSQKEDPWAAPGAAWTPAPATTTPSTPAADKSTEKLEEATAPSTTSASEAPTTGKHEYAPVEDGTPEELKGE